MTASGLYSYSALAGSGSDTFQVINQSRGWRAALFGTVAAGALWSMVPKPARAGPDACVISGAGNNIATCTGNQSGGITSNGGTPDFDPATIDTLNVNTLNRNIAPPSGIGGIYFHRGGAYESITINSNTSPFSISVTGANVNGIDVSGIDAVTINHTGDITSAGGSGIAARSTYGDLSVTSSGKINSYNDTISARVDSARSYGYTFYNGNVSVNHTGDLTSTNGRGIFAYSHYGNVNIISSGTIHSYGDGIYAKAGTSFGYYATGGSITINHTGDITVLAGRGISAVALSGNIDITSNGNITSSSDGIFATTRQGITAGYGNITIHHTGDITSQVGSGIYAAAALGSAYVKVTGNINAFNYGIAAFGLSSAQVVHSGAITANTGIFVYTALGDATVTSNGNITTTGDGIVAKVSYGAYVYSFSPSSGHAFVTHTGDITSTNGRGIYAAAYYNDVKVYNTGKIKSLQNGITAVVKPGYYGFSSGNVTVHQTGDVTSYGANGIFAASYRGSVTVISQGNITAFGDGIVAAGFTGVTISHTGDITSVAGSGISAYSPIGPISVTSVGNISAYLYGIDAKSTGGDVTVNHTGNITAQGSAIYAAAFGHKINITVNGGTIRGGYAGINFYGSTMSTISIGSGATVTGGSFAIIGGGGDDTVNNSGTVTGNVDLLSGANAFNNLAGGTFNSGATINLGAGNALTNSGTLSPGGIGSVQTTALTGNFAQTASGKFAIDLNLAGGTSDRLDVSGTAAVNGVVAPHWTSSGSIAQTFTILSATLGTVDNGLTVQNSGVVNYQLTYPNANDIQLQILSVNFASSGLTPNEQAVANDLQQAFLAGGGNLSDLLAFLTNLDPAAYAAALDRLHPAPYLAQTQSVLLSGFDFANSLFSCPIPLQAGRSLLGEESCYWLQPSGHVTNQSGQTGYFGFSEKAAGLTGGMQTELKPNWYLDAGFGYERSRIDVDSAVASALGDVFHGGAAFKYIRDHWLVAGSVSGSFARYDTSRYGVPMAGTASAHADSGMLDLKMRLAYALGNTAFYVKPLVDFDAIALWRGAINESGAGALDLQVQSQTDWLASIAPGIEFGRQMQRGNTIWRPYVRTGVRFLSNDSLSATANFAGAPAGVAPFTVTSPLDHVLAEVSAGFDVWQEGRYNLRIGYDGRFGANTSGNGGEFKLRAEF